MNPQYIPGFLPPTTPNNDSRSIDRDPFGKITFTFLETDAAYSRVPIRLVVELDAEDMPVIDDKTGQYIFDKIEEGKRAYYVVLNAEDKNLDPGDYIFKFYIDRTSYKEMRVSVRDDYVVDGDVSSS